MTFNEACGVHGCDIDNATGERVPHHEIYRRAIWFFGGLKNVTKYIPFTRERIAEALAEDEHLNNLPLSDWDRASGFSCRGADCVFIGGGLWKLYEAFGITSASNSQGVCLLKEAARMWVEDDWGIHRATFYTLHNLNHPTAMLHQGFTDGKVNYYKDALKWWAILAENGRGFIQGKTLEETIRTARSISTQDKLETARRSGTLEQYKRDFKDALAEAGAIDVLVSMPDIDELFGEAV